jgi:ABC-2 type transport system permease protein
MQHRVSFFLDSGANFLASMTDFVGIWVIVNRFHTIGGWTFPEIAILYGIIHMGFGFAEGLARGFDTFGRIVLTGEFDRVLLRPIGTILQMGTRQIQVLKVGRILQGLAFFSWGFYELKIPFFSFQMLLAFFCVVGALCLFYALFVMKAALAFWTTETLRVTDVTTYGGREVGQFPMHIFPIAFRLFFTAVIPIACVAYYPMAALLGKESISPCLAYLAPASGVLFLFLACRLWYAGVRRYCAVGC